MSPSQSSKLKQILDTAVSFCLICVSIALVVVAIRYWRDSSSASIARGNDSAVPNLQKGQLLPLSSVRQKDPTGNLLLVSLQSGCHFCRESLPLYHRLVNQSDRLNAKIVFVFSEPTSTASTYLRSNGFSNVDLQQIDFNAIHVAGTPTLILVDAKNRVLDYWVGKLPDGDIAGLFRTLGAGG